jgi:hypothetical protein
LGGTLDCTLEVKFSLGSVFLHGGSFDHVVIGFLIGYELQQLHFADHLGDGLEFALVAEEVDQEVEVFEVVLSLVEESFEVGVDSLVDVPVVVFLSVRRGTS